MMRLTIAVPVDHDRIRDRRLMQRNTFLRKHGERAVLKPGRTGTAMVSRIITEAQAGANRFDVCRRHSPSYMPMRERTLIAPYLSPEFPSLYNDFYDPKGYWATVYLNHLVLDTILKSSLQTICLNLRGSAQTSIQAKVHYRYRKSRRVRGLESGMGHEKAIAYFKGLAKAGTGVSYCGNTNRGDMVSVGERSMTFVYAQVIERMKQPAAPVDWIPLEPVK